MRTACGPAPHGAALDHHHNCPPPRAKGGVEACGSRPVPGSGTGGDGGLVGRRHGAGARPPPLPPSHPTAAPPPSPRLSFPLFWQGWSAVNGCRAGGGGPPARWRGSEVVKGQPRRRSCGRRSTTIVTHSRLKAQGRPRPTASRQPGSRAAKTRGSRHPSDGGGPRTYPLRLSGRRHRLAGVCHAALLAKRHQCNQALQAASLCSSTARPPTGGPAKSRTTTTGGKTVAAPPLSTPVVIPGQPRRRRGCRRRRS